MIVSQRKRIICITAHPLGCAEMFAFKIGICKKSSVKDKPRIFATSALPEVNDSPQIMGSFWRRANTIGVHFDKKPSEIRTGLRELYHPALC
jgi:trans-2-enoyl-CoA reductase